MKRWSNLGIVETIFEEESDDLQSISSPPLSPFPSYPSTPLQSAIDAWTKTTGRKPDIKIHVQEICFHLHKEPLMIESSYLKHHLTGVTEFTLPPTLKITADTFRQVADFCYCGHNVITPFNVAALRIAADLLGMNGEGGRSDGICGGESLGQRTEYYLCMVVAVNRDFTCSVFRSCLSLLPEAENTAFLASRCIEALFSMDDGDDDGGGDDDGDCDSYCDGDSVVSCAEELKRVSPEDFRVIVDSMQRRFTTSHDLLYRVVDLYFLVYDGSKISEEQKTQICTCIDCSILSSSLLMHAVQNPRMPLRFIVQAMLIEQLNTHRTLFATLNTTTASNTMAKPKGKLQNQTKSQANVRSDECPATLGAILERDAALRQVAQLQAALETTSSRIETLEQELGGMKEALSVKSDKQTLLLLEQQPGRSSSCRFITPASNKMERGERGSVSASMLRFRGGKTMEPSSCSSSSSSSKLKKNQSDPSPKNKAVKKNFGQRLIWGFKSAFRVSNNSKLKEVKYEHKESVISLDHNGFRAMLKALPSGNNSHDK